MSQAVETRQELRCPDCRKLLGEFVGLAGGTFWRKCPDCKSEKEWHFPAKPIQRGQNVVR